jgi:hypothetical protein
MKSAPWICVVVCLLAASTGCTFFNRAHYSLVRVMGDPDSLFIAKQRAGIGTFPVKELTPPEAAPDLLITYGDEDEDGVVYFAHTNERLHYKTCVARIQEILQSTSGPLNVDIRGGNCDLSWELDFGNELHAISGFDRLQLTLHDARLSMFP